MARRAAAQADSPTPIRQRAKLTPYEGKEVLSTSVAITGAGDGLSKALGVEPTELHHGQRVQIVIECEVAKIRYDPVKDTEGLTRVHMLKAGVATIVPEDLVRAVLDDMQRKIELASGIQHLPLEDNAEDGDDGDTGEDPEGYYDPDADPENQPINE